MEYQIPHFSHRHPLFVRAEECNYGICRACWRPISSPLYFCKEFSCRNYFLLHKSCAELPREISHPFHPQHSLTLKANISNASLTRTPSCSACEKSCPGFSYNCSECSFELDIGCASLLPTKDADEQNLGHPHPLLMCRTPMNYEDPCTCCKLPLKEGVVYVCLDCKWLMDKSCADLPLQIQHPFHPQHSLNLQLLRLSYPDKAHCKACGKYLTGFAFRCSDCRFFLDVGCASLIPSTAHAMELQIHELGHSHSLFVCKKKRGVSLFCVACRLPFAEEEDDVCVCLDCSFLLHKKCASLPTEINQSNFHQHPLFLLECSPPDSETSLQKSLYSSSSESLPLPEPMSDTVNNVSLNRFVRKRHGVHLEFLCYACLQYHSGFAYVCPKCRVLFDITCAFSNPLLIGPEFHSHPHAFAFFDGKRPLPVECSTCNRSLHGPFLRCAQCNINIHAYCFPDLPKTIKHKTHRHTLKLTRSPVKDSPDDDDRGEFYCDECEQRRLLSEPTYYCEECHYVVHVHCMVREILGFLKEEHRSGGKAERHIQLSVEGEISKLRREILRLGAELKFVEGKLGELMARRAQYTGSELLCINLPGRVQPFP